jgi:hypothetical protein
MELKVIKSKITKLLKSNGFIKSEVKKEWNHPKYKHAGFDYNDITIYESYLSYYIPDFVYHDEVITGALARVIQHEYDHLEGILFIDHVTPLRRIMLKRKLADISKGAVKTDYKMIYPNLKKKLS